MVVSQILQDAGQDRLLDTLSGNMQRKKEDKTYSTVLRDQTFSDGRRDARTGGGRHGREAKIRRRLDRDGNCTYHLL